MRSVSVYIWKPRSGYVGHTSLSVNVFDAPVRYLSFWPEGSTKGNGAKATDLLMRRSVPSASRCAAGSTPHWNRLSTADT